MFHQVVLQGGTFLNDCILRAAEVVLARTDLVRPDACQMMGAIGAALEAQDWFKANQTNTILLDVKNLEWNVSTQRCGRCSNNCVLTVHKFSNGASCVAGNRCERGLLVVQEKSSGSPRGESCLFSEKARFFLTSH